MNKLKLEEYSLVDFMFLVQKAIQDGYTMSTDSEEAPMCIGNCYHVIMSKEDVHGKLMTIIPIANNYVETIEPPKEPTLDESLPKDEQTVIQTKQVTIAATTTPKRGKK